ncbi:hypothetical protein [Mesorhizobium sp. M7A.F.Ca.MR.245.00.0.0]|uniref:hypothetical protein n=1 Tax=Mesorhizobium sp. M7A.F.Ca.MR.245.00.0.0 TaxID=2496778 RepID=UPI000FCA28C4|nr:hypothetical protein [Mesorhizobium sp. M7A.F.Ca.MR.245.00.0.0]RUV18900.1 hypothetical protein EOB80_21400 [Mesorhizobium sp. M7A.F.Ca.MR.245.00.0.0]
MRIRFFAPALICIALCTGTHAGEFGNVLGGSAGAGQSRDASATALEAVGKVIEGLRQRELLPGSGGEQFQQAAQLFADAAKKMEAVLPFLPDEELTQQQFAFLTELKGADAQTYAVIGETKSLKDVYRSFANVTQQMSSAVGSLAGQANAFRTISPMLITYFRVADSVVALQERH